MFNNKLINISIIIVISISVLGVGSYFLYQYIFPDTEAVDQVKQPSIDEILALTVEVPKINTNLGDSTIIVIEMTLQTDNKKAKEEAEKRMFQIKDRTNLYLKSLSAESFQNEANINKFKAELIVRLNVLLQEGEIVNVDITQLFLQ